MDMFPKISPDPSLPKRGIITSLFKAARHESFDPEAHDRRVIRP